SRGYRRKLKGYALATELSLVEDIGDEPKQFKQKFPKAEVCVSENRVEGVYKLLQDEPDVHVILMDDGLQHRRINPGLKILLTAYNDLFCDDMVLPAGNLREPRSGYKRMQALIITKCPGDLKEYEKTELTKRLKLLPSQKLFFTTEVFENMKPLFAEQELKNMEDTSTCLFVSGIADNTSAVHHLKQKFSYVESMRFPDHYYFTEQDLISVTNKAEKGVFIATEKDAMRLMEHKEYLLQNNASIFVLHLSIRFLFNEGNTFHHLVENYVQSALPV
ncbi:MAG: tetraacyldisaccharide 4'-kinase, partial [Chitinophagales bacterium]